MVSPADEKEEPRLHLSIPTDRSSDEDNTVVGDNSLNPAHSTTSAHPHARFRSNSHLTVETARDEHFPSLESIKSPSHSQTRERAHRLDDDLAMLSVERQVSEVAGQLDANGERRKSLHRSRSRRPEVVDEFDVATNPLHEKAAVYKPPEHPTTNIARFFKRVHQSTFLVRYFVYIIPVVLILLIPLLLGLFLFPGSSVGGVQMWWFCVWLEIVWLTLWGGRILAKCLPWPIGLASSLFTNNSKKWRDMGKQLELPATLFFWWLAIEISFLPTMTNHHLNGDQNTREWERTMNKVLVSIFVGAILNFVEKIIIQLIAISFHLRTYADRIDLNKFQIGSLTKLYEFSKQKIEEDDSDFEEPSDRPGSGARTPGQILQEAQQTTMKGFRKFGDVAGKVAGDFTGRQVKSSTHPQQVILTLLHTTGGSQVLARRLYRTFYRPEDELVHSDDLKNAFDNEEEADAAFTMFDKDMNGDISMEELEAVCVEIGRERKAITASLKDLDSVVAKLDDVFMFIVFIITVLVFISLISTSAAGVLTSAGSAVLALSWLFSATAQEFLQSIIFVFVKHPFDVGDRVGIYGNTGSQLKGDDYFVKEISLLYTEFKKMEGHVVQAPNSYLNTLFILNQRRSGGLAEAIPVIIKFGTTLDQIDMLRTRLTEFVRAEKREYKDNILTELREVTEAHSLTLNIVFFYKSNWQNELLRLQRRNKFICAMMVSMQECGIEGPRMRYPGQKESFPVYLQNVPHVSTPGIGHGGHPDNPTGEADDPPFVAPDTAGPEGLQRRDTSTFRSPTGRQRGESIAAMGRRVDFSLGMKDISAADFAGDVYEDRDRDRSRLPPSVNVNSPSRSRLSSDSRPRISSSAARASHDVARSSSINMPDGRPGVLRRIGTDSSAAAARPMHRNRFFGRGSRVHDDEFARMESGLADVPENEKSGAAGSPASGVSGGQKLDPRSGLVSPTAVRSSDDGGSRIVPGIRHAATDNFEMRRL